MRRLTFTVLSRTTTARRISMSNGFEDYGNGNESTYEQKLKGMQMAAI